MLILLPTALIPLIVGAVYYHPKVVGTAWMRANHFTEEDLKGANMALIFGLSFVMSILLALLLQTIVIHQMGVFSLLSGQEGFDDPASAVRGLFNDFMELYGAEHRTFGHGALHGAIAAGFFAVPILTINGLFERRSWRYVLIHAGYWLITLALMGGVLGQFAPLPIAE
jgi:hypothetical protein